MSIICPECGMKYVIKKVKTKDGILIIKYCPKCHNKDDVKIIEKFVEMFIDDLKNR